MEAAKLTGRGMAASPPLSGLYENTSTLKVLLIKSEEERDVLNQTKFSWYFYSQ